MPKIIKVKKLSLCFFIALVLILATSGFALANTLESPKTDGVDVLNAGRAPYGIAAGNLDSDNVDEVAVANFQGNSISIFDRKANSIWARQDFSTVGTYWISATETSSFSSSNPCAITIGDVTGDNLNDVIVSDEWNHRILIFPQAGGHIEQATLSFSTGNIFETHPFSNPYQMVLGDFNNDGFKDIAVANFYPGTGSLGDNYKIYDGVAESFDLRSTGVTFTTFKIEYHNLTTDPASGTLRFYRRRNNGWVISPQSEESNPNWAIFTNNPEEVKIPSNYINVHWDSTNSYIEIKKDAVLQSATVTVFLQSPSVSGLGFDKFDWVGYNSDGYPYSIAAGDFNFDGKDDLAVANYNAPSPQHDDIIRIWRQNVQKFLVHDIEQDYKVGYNPFSMVCAELSGDTRFDLATSNWGADNISVILQNTVGRFDNQINYPSGVRPLGITAGDLNNDGLTDISVVNGNSDTISVFSRENYSISSYLNPLVTGYNGITTTYDLPYPCGYALANGDVDGDGLKEIIVTSNDSHNKLMIFHQKPPDSPAISLPQSEKGYYNSSTTISLLPPKDINGIKGYYLSLTTSENVTPDRSSYFTANPVVKPSDINSSLRDGDWWLSALSLDNDGHLGVTPVRVKLPLDTVSPTSPLLSSLVYSTTGKGAITWRPSKDTASGLKGYYYQLDNMTEAFASPSTRSFDVHEQLSVGAHIFSVRAADYAGNFSPWAKQRFVYDPSAPYELKVISPSKDQHIKGYLPIKIRTKDKETGIKWVLFKVDRIRLKSVWTPLRIHKFNTMVYFDSKVLDDGDHEIEVSSCDMARNVTKSSVHFFVDNYKPRISKIYVTKKSGKFLVNYMLHESFFSQVKLVIMRVVDKYGNTVFRKRDGFKFASPKGTWGKTIWNGRNARGARVKPGIYKVFLRAIDKAGNAQKAWVGIRLRITRE